MIKSNICFKKKLSCNISLQSKDAALIQNTESILCDEWMNRFTFESLDRLVRDSIDPIYSDSIKGYDDKIYSYQIVLPKMTERE